MKNFLKNFFTFEPPWSEVWLGVGIVAISFVLGFINRSTAAEWLLAIATFALILLATFLFYLLWRRTTRRGRQGYVLGFVVLTLIASFPFGYDTDDAYDAVTREHGLTVFQAIRAVTPGCTDDGVGVSYAPFGTTVSYCDHRWFILFNRWPFQVSGGDLVTTPNEAWVTYENAYYGFSFTYPKSGVVEIDTELPQESPYFFKVYERDKYTDDTDRFGDKPLKYSIAFLDYATEAKWPSACLRHIPEYETIQFGEIEAYTGITVPDEWTGVGGGSTKVCVTRDGRNFAVVGQDFTEENILERMIQSIQFTHPSPAHAEPVTHTLPPVPVPEGWYEHLQTASHSTLTRSPTLPDAGPDPRAYGEQITISTGRFDGDRDNRERWHYIRWVFEDEALVRDWSWTTLRGLDALRVESEAAGASGGIVYYFIFAGDQFYTLSLYPFDTSQHIAEFEELVWRYAVVIYASSTFETRAAGIARAAKAMQDLVSHDDVAVEEIIATYYDLVLPNGSVQTSIFSKSDTNLHDFFFPYIGELSTKVIEGGQPEYEAFRQAFVLPDAPAADFAFPYRVGNTSGGRMVGTHALDVDTRIAYGAYHWAAYGGPPAHLCKKSGIIIDTFTFKNIDGEWKMWEIDNTIDQWVTNKEGATEEACREINQDKIKSYQNP